MRGTGKPRLGPVRRDEGEQDVRVLNPDAFLRAMISRYSGGDSRCSLEGRLSHYRFPEELNKGESDSLRRHTLWSWPRDTFFASDLKADTAALILAKLGQDPLWSTDHVEHFQIEAGGRLVVGAYDNLDVNWIGSSFGDEELQRMVSAGVIELIPDDSSK
jgi:hypothetical protein